jgi:flagellar hook-associated protein 3 FlgL
MRVSEAFSQRTFIRDLGRVRARLDEAMARVSSGLRIRHASDDSQAAAELMKIADESQRLAMRRQVLSQARPWLQLSEQAVTELENILITANQLTIQGASETLQQANRDAIAEQVAGLRNQLRSLTNLRIGGRYVFSGTLTDVAPYDSAGTYQGNGEQIEFPLDDGREALNLIGSSIFGEEGVGGPMELLRSLEAALRSGDVAALQALTTPMRDAISENSAMVARVGNRRKSLEDSDLRLQDRQLTTTRRAADLGSADMAQALSDVQQFQTGYQATLAAGARLFGPSFFDYIG